MIDFRDVRPDWEVGRRAWSNDELAGLGASPEVTRWLRFGNLDSDHLLVQPEEWFWRDKDWFGKDGCVAELKTLAGGSFCSMSLPQQCELLGIPLIEVKGEKADRSRGMWQGRHGPVTTEQLALEHFEVRGARGFTNEGHGYQSWAIARRLVAEAKFNWKPEHQVIGGETYLFTPGEKEASLQREALEVTRQKIDFLYEKKRKYLDRLWAPMGLGDVKAFAELVGWETLHAIDDLYFRYGASVTFGWLDLTMRINGQLQFVEVKANDRLRGNQARWIRNVARPLGLEVAVCRIVAA